jgi:YVTN family beta-propeller protein
LLPSPGFRAARRTVQNEGMPHLVLLLAILTAGASASAQVLILHKGDDSLGVYDPESGKLLGKIPTGAKPHEFAVTPDERLAFVSNYGVDSYTEDRQGGNTLTIIDLAQRRPAGEISLGQYHRPHGIRLARSGRLYVTCDFPPALAVIDSRRQRLLHAIPVSGKLPHMVAVTADERQAWTADSGSGTVSVVDLRNRRQRASVAVGGVPMGIALSPDEKTLFVGTRTDNAVVVVDAVTNTVRRKIGVAGQPSRVIVSPDGRWVYVSLIESGEVAIIDASTLLEVRRARVGSHAEGIQLDAEGNTLFVSAQGDNRTVRFRLPSLEVITVFETAARPDPVYLLRGLRR